jgi:hypothetical protein
MYPFSSFGVVKHFHSLKPAPGSRIANRVIRGSDVCTLGYADPFPILTDASPCTSLEMTHAPGSLLPL